MCLGLVSRHVRAEVEMCYQASQGQGSRIGRSGTGTLNALKAPKAQSLRQVTSTCCTLRLRQLLAQPERARCLKCSLMVTFQTRMPEILDIL